MINIGLWMYDGLALFRNYRNHQMFSNAEITRRMRGFDVKNINGGAYYYDGQVDDARLTLETIRTAHKHGAVIANYVQVDGLLKEKGKVVGVQAHDTLRGDKMEIRARVVVNATGPWTDTLLQLDDPSAPKRMRSTKGIHLLVPREKIGGESAVAFPCFSDGRLMFVIPWGPFSIIGTTDTDYTDDFDRVRADKADVDYVLAAANHAFPGAPITKGDVISTYAGLRPLVLQVGKSASRTSREHEIWATESGLVTIAGGKLTTYRSMAEELVDLVAKRLRDEFSVVAKNPCTTARTPLVEEQGAIPPMNVTVDVMAHLIYAHGPEQWRVLEIAKRGVRLAQPIVEGLPYIWAEVQYAIEQEMAMTVTDVLERRLHLLTESRENGVAAAPQVAKCLGEFQGWNRARVEKELRAYQAQVDLTNAFKR
jgi:glycerol-3-phosphate dehydrogenase